jgi:hypothetical protein
MKFFLPALLCLSIDNFAYAQTNLVPNGSFEDYYSCPWSNGQVDSCVGWYGMGGIGNPFPGTPDYFNSCSGPIVNVPDNTTGGYQSSFEGNAYMGLLTYIWSGFWREIIGTKLTDTLIPGNPYHVSMRVSRGNWTNQAYNVAASNKLGLRFTTFEHTISDPPSINNYAQLYVDSIITDTLNWVLLQWEYVPDSPYTHVYIGNFFDDANTDTLVINAPLGQFGQAYYFIDSVNISCIGKDCISGIDSTAETKAYIEYHIDSKTIEFYNWSNNKGIVSIFNSAGKLVLSETMHAGIPISLSFLSKGLYLVRLGTEEKYLVKKIIVN